MSRRRHHTAPRGSRRQPAHLGLRQLRKTEKDLLGAIDNVGALHLRASPSILQRVARCSLVYETNDGAETATEQAADERILYLFGTFLVICAPLDRIHAPAVPGDSPPRFRALWKVILSETQCSVRPTGDLLLHIPGHEFMFRFETPHKAGRWCKYILGSADPYCHHIERFKRRRRRVRVYRVSMNASSPKSHPTESTAAQTAAAKQQTRKPKPKPKRKKAVRVSRQRVRRRTRKVASKRDVSTTSLMLPKEHDEASPNAAKYTDLQHRLEEALEQLRVVHTERVDEKASLEAQQAELQQRCASAMEQVTQLQAQLATAGAAQASQGSEHQRALSAANDELAELRKAYERSLGERESLLHRLADRSHTTATLEAVTRLLGQDEAAEEETPVDVSTLPARIAAMIAEQRELKRSLDNVTQRLRQTESQLATSRAHEDELLEQLCTMVPAGDAYDWMGDEGEDIVTQSSGWGPMVDRVLPQSYEGAAAAPLVVTQREPEAHPVAHKTSDVVSQWTPVHMEDVGDASTCSPGLEETAIVRTTSTKAQQPVVLAPHPVDRANVRDVLLASTGVVSHREVVQPVTTECAVDEVSSELSSVLSDYDEDISVVEGEGDDDAVVDAEVTEDSDECETDTADATAMVSAADADNTAARKQRLDSANVVNVRRRSSVLLAETVAALQSDVVVAPHARTRAGAVSQPPQGDEAAALSEQLAHRAKVVEEIITTEQAYVDGITLLVKRHEQPLAKLPHVLDPNDHKELFANVHSILPVNQTLLAKLKEEVEKDVNEQRIGLVFQGMAPFLRMYKQYCSKQDAAQALCSELPMRNHNFAEWLARVQRQPEFRQLPLADYLVKPLQRICKYPLLLKALLQATPVDHPDHANIAHALQELSDTVSELNEEKRAYEAMEVMADLQASIQWQPLFDHTYDLVRPGRHLLLSAPMHVTNRMGRKKLGSARRTNRALKHKAYLFTDVLLVTRTVSSRGEVAHAVMPLDAHTTVNRLRNMLVCMRNDDCLVMNAATPEDAEVWLVAMRAQLPAAAAAAAAGASPRSGDAADAIPDNGSVLRRLAVARLGASGTSMTHLLRQPSVADDVSTSATVEATAAPSPGVAGSADHHHPHSDSGTDRDAEATRERGSLLAGVHSAQQGVDRCGALHLDAVTAMRGSAERVRALEARRAALVSAVSVARDELAQAQAEAQQLEQREAAARDAQARMRERTQAAVAAVKANTSSDADTRARLMEAAALSRDALAAMYAAHEAAEAAKDRAHASRAAHERRLASLEHEEHRVAAEASAERDRGARELAPAVEAAERELAEARAEEAAALAALGAEHVARQREREATHAARVAVEHERARASAWEHEAEARVAAPVHASALEVQQAQRERLEATQERLVRVEDQVVTMANYKAKASAALRARQKDIVTLKVEARKAAAQQQQLLSTVEAQAAKLRAHADSEASSAADAQRLRELEATAAAATTALAEAHGRLETADAQLDTLRAQLSAVEADRDSKADEVDQLQQDYGEVRAQLAQVESEAKDMTSKYEESQRLEDELRLRLVTLEREMANPSVLSRDVHALEAKLEETQSALEEAQAVAMRIQEEQDERRAAEAEAAQLREALQRARDRGDEHQEETADLRSKLHLLRLQLTKSQSSQDELQSSFQGAMTQVTKLEAELAEAQLTLRRVQQQQQQQQGEDGQSTSVSTSSANDPDVTTERDQLRAELRAKGVAHASLRREATDLKIDMQSLRVRYEETQRQLRDAQAERAEVLRAQGELSEQRDLLQRDAQSLRALMRDALNREAELQDRVRELETTVAEARAHTSTHEPELRVLQLQLMRAQETEASLRAQLKALEESDAHRDRTGLDPTGKERYDDDIGDGDDEGDVDGEGEL